MFSNTIKSALLVGLVFSCFEAFGFVKLPQPEVNNNDKEVRLHTAAVITSATELEDLNKTFEKEGLTDEDVVLVEKEDFNTDVVEELTQAGLNADSVKEDLMNSEDAALVLVYKAGYEGRVYKTGGYYAYGPRYRRVWRRYYTTPYYCPPGYVVPGARYYAPRRRYRYYRPYRRRYYAPRRYRRVWRRRRWRRW